MPVSGTAIPASFARIGVSYVWVTANTVQICLWADENGGAWGFLYDPKRAYGNERSPDEVRPTWYDDLYEFTLHGE